MVIIIEASTRCHNFHGGQPLTPQNNDTDQITISSVVVRPTLCRCLTNPFHPRDPRSSTIRKMDGLVTSKVCPFPRLLFSRVIPSIQKKLAMAHKYRALKMIVWPECSRDEWLFERVRCLSVEIDPAFQRGFNTVDRS